MFNDENIAAAQIAQIFGSELLKAQQSARTDSGSTPQFVKIDPKQFLAQHSPAVRMQQRAEEQRLMQLLQKEAEAAYPLAETSQSLPAQPNSSPELPTHTTSIPNHSSIPLKSEPVHTVGKVTTSTSPVLLSNLTQDVWERIATSLERIATRLEKSDINIKKRRVKKSSVPS